jgi:hypothetical protein
MQKTNYLPKRNRTTIPFSALFLLLSNCINCSTFMRGGGCEQKLLCKMDEITKELAVEIHNALHAEQPAHLVYGVPPFSCPNSNQVVVRCLADLVCAPLFKFQCQFIHLCPMVAADTNQITRKSWCRPRRRLSSVLSPT